MVASAGKKLVQPGEGITIPGLAAHLRVSVSTVAKALAGDVRVAAKTRERVRQAAEKLGYQPNPAASLMARLRHRRERKGAGRLSVALVGPRASHLPQGWKEACAEVGVDGSIVVWPEAEQQQMIFEKLWYQGVSGLILMTEGAPQTSRKTKPVNWWRFSVVKLQRVRADLPFHVVRHDAFDYTMLALRKSGLSARRRLAVLLWQTESEEDNLARLGALLAYREVLLPRGVDLVWRYWPGEVEKADPEIVRWLDAQKPDVILFYHFSMLQALEDVGWEPEEVPKLNAILHKPTYPYLRYPLSGCDLSDESHLRKALRMVLEMIGRGDRGFPKHPTEHIIEPDWFEAG